MDSPSSQITSRFGGAVGAALLVAVLFVLVLGVYGAVYMEAFRPAAPSSPPLASALPTKSAQSPTQAATPSETRPTPPAASAPPLPTVAIPPASDLAQINPAASRSAPAPIEAAKPPYWVEYGAYDGPFYARRLIARLGATGITAEIKQVHGVGGRRYYSVRSTETSDRTGAERYIRLAAAHLGIAPLLHRGDGWALAKPVAVAKPPPAARAGERETGYWVQFGAFNRPGFAQALRERLSRAGVTTTIIERHRPGRARFLVRSASSLRRADAQSLAARGASLLGIAPLVGHAPKQDRRNI